MDSTLVVGINGWGSCKSEIQFKDEKRRPAPAVSLTDAGSPPAADTAASPALQFNHVLAVLSPPSSSSMCRSLVSASIGSSFNSRDAARLI